MSANFRILIALVRMNSKRKKKSAEEPEKETERQAEKRTKTSDTVEGYCLTNEIYRIIMIILNFILLLLKFIKNQWKKF